MRASAGLLPAFLMSGSDLRGDGERSLFVRDPVGSSTRRGCFPSARVRGCVCFVYCHRHVAGAPDRSWAGSGKSFGASSTKVPNLAPWWPWASCFINFALRLPHWKGAVILQPCWSVERVRGIHRWHKGVCVCECIKHITWHWVADGRCSGRGSCHLDVISQEGSPVH